MKRAGRASTAVVTREGTAEGLTAFLPRHDRVELAVHPASPALARTHVGRVLTEWGHEELGDNARLVVSELVTNALMVSGLALPDSVDNVTLYDTDGAAHIWVDLYEIDGFVVLAVWDTGAERPRVRRPDADEEGGRGLLLVNALCAAWGCREAETGGKIVWAALAIR